MCHLKLVFPYWLCLDDLSIAVSGLLKVLFLCYCRFLLYGWWDFSDILGCFYVGCIYICCCSVAKSCPTLYNPMTITHQAPLSFTISWSLLKSVSIELVMLSNHLVLCLCLLCLPSVFPSIRVFPYESILHIRWPKYWRFSFINHPSNEYSSLISFKIDWFDLFAVEGTFKSFLQLHNSKAQILRCSTLLWSNSHIHTWLLENHSFD